MKRHVNFREGCRGCIYNYKIHCCNDCYNECLVGGATRVHPTARRAADPNRQLDRIESLAKQAASYSVFWPCFLTFAATSACLGGYFIW